MNSKAVLALTLGVLTAAPTFAADVLTASKVMSMKGKYTYELLQDPTVSGLVASSLTKEFVDNTSTSTPAEVVDGRFLIAGGCEPHNCGDNRAIFVIDSKNPKALLVVRKQKNDFSKNEDNTVVIPNPAWNQSLSGSEQRYPGLRKAIEEL